MRRFDHGSTRPTSNVPPRLRRRESMMRSMADMDEG